MCAVLLAKWIKISVVLRSVICIWADTKRSSREALELAATGLLQISGNCPCGPSIEPSDFGHTKKNQTKQKKKKWRHRDGDQSTLRANWQLPTFINRSQQGVEWHSSAKSWQGRSQIHFEPGHRFRFGFGLILCSTCGPMKRPQSTRNQALNGLSVGPKKKGRTIIILYQQHPQISAPAAVS